MLQTRLTPEIVTRPTTEPITLVEAKKQCEIATSDTAHDDHVNALIADARQKWEDDTDSALCNQTWRVVTSGFEDGMKLPKRPIQSITSITYYDGTNTQKTLGTDIYQLHVGRQELRLQWLKIVPVSLARWDAWTITYLCGYGADGTNVPGVAKRAMMMLIGYHYDANRGDNDRPNDMAHYERLVLGYMRSSYP